MLQIGPFWPRPKSTYAIQHREQNVKVDLVSLIFGTFSLISGVVVVVVAAAAVVVRAMPNPFIIGLLTLMVVVVVVW